MPSASGNPVLYGSANTSSGWGGLDESDLAEETVQKTDNNESVDLPLKELGRGSKKKVHTRIAQCF